MKSEAMKPGVTNRTATFVLVSAVLISVSHCEPGLICLSDQLLMEPARSGYRLCPKIRFLGNLWRADHGGCLQCIKNPVYLMHEDTEYDPLPSFPPTPPSSSTCNSDISAILREFRELLRINPTGKRRDVNQIPIWPLVCP